MNYQVKAIRGKEILMMEIFAVHEQDALRLAKEQGYQPISVRKRADGILRQHKKFSLPLFSQELLALLEAGLNLVEAIESLSEKSGQPEAQRILLATLTSLRQGNPFSVSLERQPEIFPLLFVATIRASEKTGNLPEALRRYVAYETQMAVLKKRIVSASIYPLLLAAVGSLVILFLLGFVVPKFSHIYEGTGTELPYLSQILLHFGAFLDAYGSVFLAGVILVMVSLILTFTQRDARGWVVRLLWKIPTLGDKLQIYQLARFYRTLGMLLNGGMPILQAMKSVSGLLDTALQSKMEQAKTAISEGEAISEALTKAQLATPIASRMLLVGERSGSIGSMMERIADFYDEELSRWIDWFTRLFEPVLMLFIGLVIGVVVLLLYMPIFELAGNIQ